MIKAIINTKIYDYENYIPNGYIIFDKKIIEVGEMSNFINHDYEIIDGKGKLTLPGMVCAHSHIYSIFARGLVLPFNPKNFVEILSQMWWKIDREIDNDITYYSGIVASVEFMKNGVTTIIDHHASGTDITGSLEALKKAIVDDAKLRALLAFEVSDRFNVDDCIKENATFIKNNHTDHVAGLFGLHASMTLSDDTLKKVSESLNNAPIHVHVAESEMDQIDSLDKYGMRIINRLNDFHLITKNSLIVHGVFLEDKELNTIKNNGAYLVINTTSNMNNAVGLPNYARFVESGNKVLIGNDGLSSMMGNEYQNALFTGHLKSNSPTIVNLNYVRNSINDAYDYVSKILGVKLGKIKKDYEADLLLIPYDPFTKMDASNAFGHIFYGLYPAFKPERVFATGNEIVKNYEVSDPKLLEKYSAAKESASKLWNKLSKGE